jgi:hypothetical protein
MRIKDQKCMRLDTGHQAGSQGRYRHVEIHFLRDASVNEDMLLQMRTGLRTGTGRAGEQRKL